MVFLLKYLSFYMLAARYLPNCILFGCAYACIQMPAFCLFGLADQSVHLVLRTNIFDRENALFYGEFF